MSRRRSEPLSKAEIAFLIQLANGNALARQRQHDREAARSRRQPPHQDE